MKKVLVFALMFIATVAQADSMESRVIALMSQMEIKIMELERDGIIARKLMHKAIKEDGRNRNTLIAYGKISKRVIENSNYVIDATMLIDSIKDKYPEAYRVAQDYAIERDFKYRMDKLGELGNELIVLEDYVFNSLVR